LGTIQFTGDDLVGTEDATSPYVIVVELLQVSGGCRTGYATAPKPCRVSSGLRNRSTPGMSARAAT